MLKDVQLNWLLTEGMIPLFGAGAVYLIWGIFRKLAAPRNRYGWREAVDPMGWLYGAIIIAVQSAARCFAAGPAYRTLGIFCIICGVFCGMQLLAAMTERGADLNWRPGINFKIVAVIVVVITLCSGYMAQPVAQSCAASAQKESK